MAKVMLHLPVFGRKPTDIMRDRFWEVYPIYNASENQMNSQFMNTTRP